MEEEQEMEMEALQLELDSLLCEARLEKLDQFVNSLRTQAENSKQLQAEVQELKSEIASLKQSFQSHSSQYQPDYSPRGPRFQNFRGRGRGGYLNRSQQYRCRTCKARGCGQNCQHCFNSGEIGHIRSQCQAEFQPQGNESRLLQGGAE